MNPDLLSLPLSLLEFMEYTYRVSRADTELENFRSILNSTDGLLSRIASTHSADEWVVAEIQSAKSAVERGKALLERTTAARKARGGRLRGWRWGWVLRDREAAEGIKGMLLHSHVTLLYICGEVRSVGRVEGLQEEELESGWSGEVLQSTGMSVRTLPWHRKYLTESRYLPGHFRTTTYSTMSTGPMCSRGYQRFGGRIGEAEDPQSPRDAWLLQKAVERARFDMSS